MRSLLVVPMLLVALTASGCSEWGGEAKDPSLESRRSARLDAARLHELELTYEIPAQVRRACAEARRQASVRVICPRLIPDVPLTKSEGLWGSIVGNPDAGYYMLTFNNGGLPGGKRHWITGGGKAGAVEKWVLTDFQNATKGDPKLVRTMTVRGRRVSIYRFPPYPAGGPNGGHWAAFVRIGDEIVFASPHERRYIAAAVEMALALAEQAEATNDA